MKTKARPTNKTGGLTVEKRLDLEDQIMERALALWRKPGPGHRNALNAWLQAEQEVLVQERMRQATRKFNLGFRKD
jgi:Protein of unknown function (DUF2934)